MNDEDENDQQFAKELHDAAVRANETSADPDGDIRRTARMAMAALRAFGPAAVLAPETEPDARPPVYSIRGRDVPLVEVEDGIARWHAFADYAAQSPTRFDPVIVTVDQAEAEYVAFLEKRLKDLTDGERENARITIERVLLQYEVLPTQTINFVDHDEPHPVRVPKKLADYLERMAGLEPPSGILCGSGRPTPAGRRARLLRPGKSKRWGRKH